MCGVWILVMNEGYVVVNRAIIFAGGALADERVAGDPAIVADPHALLHLHKSANVRVIANLLSVQVDLWVDLDVLAKFDIGDDGLMTHGGSISRPTVMGPAARL